MQGVFTLCIDSMFLFRKFYRYFGHFVVAFLVTELVLFNCAMFYGYFMIKGALDAFHNTNGGFLDKLSSSQSIRSLLEAAKDGGVSKLLEGTVERVFLISYPDDSADKINLPKITFLGIDMSNAGEIGFIYRRIQSSDFKFSRLVIDIGANDGLISSNSFNLIQLGWSAILVEPVPSQMDLAKMNTYRFVDSNPNQNITYIQAAIGSKDGSTNFVVTDDLGTMQNHFASQHHYAGVGHKMTIPVRTITVQTLVTQYHVPKRFGVLSIDAEGTGDSILHQFIKLGYRPAYIIYEALHNKEPIQYTTRYLKKNGYVGLTKRGWNYIFEYKYKTGSD